MSEAPPPSFATLPLAACLVCGWLGLTLLGAAFRLSAALGLKSDMADNGVTLSGGEELQFWLGTVGIIALTMVMALLSIIALIGLRAASSVYLTAATVALGWPIPQLLFGTGDRPLAFQLIDAIPALVVFFVLFTSPSIGEAFALRTPFNTRKTRSGLIDKIRGRD